MSNSNKKQSVALVIYGEEGSTKNALTDDKYKALANGMIEAGFTVDSVLYNDTIADRLETDLAKYAAVLVWVNPIEQGTDRKRLDALLENTAAAGVYVSTLPETIMKIGTKKVLYTSREMDWGGDTKMYIDYADFEKRFFPALSTKDIRVLKQYRGNGGNGVFKVSLENNDAGRIRVIHAPSPNDILTLSPDDFFQKFKPYFNNGGLLVDQAWAQGLENGVVRSYVSGIKVSGFGYQESNALNSRPVSGRFYYSEHCGLFQDLREILESKWIPQLMEIHSLKKEKMPILWDIDLFINDVNSTDTAKKYTLCEINVSCVSPFPVSCIGHVVDNLKKVL